MTTFSLIKVGNVYVVRADDQCILKIASRSKAARLISQAAVLLDADAAAERSQAQTPAEISIDSETPEAP
ncbi:MAG: hypothetical protein HY852_11250 [Bradyrhizobium sp.]|uniref:hypothetical protein n=1 Tax=Bradyrhizobium sp. TaxID=376 RepID=UPI0025BE0226|nr:hypothetical protein [Bradyrhizobium sp.]MBI5262377.1 hypothetical protein [Bradyrhizobium sp.]